MLQDEKAKEAAAKDIKDKEKAKDSKEAKDGKDKDATPGSRQASEPPAEPANAKSDAVDKDKDAGKDTGKDTPKGKDAEGGADAAKDKGPSQPQADASAAAAAAGDAAADASAAASPVAAAPLPSVAPPEEPGLQLRGRAGPGSERVKTVSLSLHGLLEYDETDRDEPTFELSVFAECVQDMLVREYGMAVYRGLLADRWDGQYGGGVPRAVCGPVRFWIRGLGCYSFKYEDLSEEDRLAASVTLHRLYHITPFMYSCREHVLTPQTAVPAVAAAAAGGGGGAGSKRGRDDGDTAAAAAAAGGSQPSDAAADGEGEGAAKKPRSEVRRRFVAYMPCGCPSHLH